MRAMSEEGCGMQGLQEGLEMASAGGYLQAQDGAPQTKKGYASQSYCGSFADRL